MKVYYCRVKDRGAVENLIESGRFIPTKDTGRYLYGKCIVGDCPFCEKIDRNKYSEYYTVEYQTEDEKGNIITVTFEPKFSGE